MAAGRLYTGNIKLQQCTSITLYIYGGGGGGPGMPKFGANMYLCAGGGGAGAFISFTITDNIINDILNQTLIFSIPGGGGAGAFTTCDLTTNTNCNGGAGGAAGNPSTSATPSGSGANTTISYISISSGDTVILGSAQGGSGGEGVMPNQQQSIWNQGAGGINVYAHPQAIVITSEVGGGSGGQTGWGGCVNPAIPNNNSYTYDYGASYNEKSAVYTIPGNTYYYMPEASSTFTTYYSPLNPYNFGGGAQGADVVGLTTKVEVIPDGECMNSNYNYCYDCNSATGGNSDPFADQYYYTISYGGNPGAIIIYYRF